MKHRSFVRLRRPAVLLWLLLITVSFGRSVQADPVRGQAIAAERIARDTGWGDSEATTKMVLRNSQGKESIRLLRTLALEVPNGGDKGLTIFDEPKDVRGTAFLNHTHIGKPDDQWLYLPAVKRVKRIASANKSGPFMASEFAYEDLTSFELDKFQFSFVREERIEGQNCAVVEQIPTDKASGYSKMLVWVDLTHYRVLKTEYFDKKQSLLKTLLLRDYQLYQGKFWRSRHMVMQNHQTGKSTTLLTSDIRFAVGKTAADFDSNALQRVR
jgi:outer membrane lipoprotein-sorting protein